MSSEIFRKLRSCEMALRFVGLAGADGIPGFIGELGNFVIGLAGNWVSGTAGNSTVFVYPITNLSRFAGV